MSHKRLKALAGLAAMIRDREMAELARLAGERRALEEERARIGQEARVAREAGQASIPLAGAAEAFDRWAILRQQQIGQSISGLQERIDAQKARTAKAVGRHKNIGEIEKTVRAADEKKAAQKL